MAQFGVLMVLLLVASAATGGNAVVSRSYEEACTIWQERAAASTSTPWVNGTLQGDCSDSAVGAMPEVKIQNVVDQVNLYRRLAGLPYVASNATKNLRTMTSAWWSALLFESGTCEWKQTFTCARNNQSLCWTQQRQTWLTDLGTILLVGGTGSDQMAVSAPWQTQKLFSPALTSIGVGMCGNLTGHYSVPVDGNFTGFTSQIIDLSPDVQPASFTDSWLAYPPDGVIEYSAVSVLDHWFFATTTELDSTVTVKVVNLTNNDFEDLGAAYTLSSASGWSWLSINFTRWSLLAPDQEYQVNVNVGNFTWVYRPFFVNCSAPAKCGNGVCQQPYETAQSCPEDCSSCGTYPESLNGLDARCVNGTWLVSGSIELADGATLAAGTAAITFAGDFVMPPTATLQLAAANSDSFGSVTALGCWHVDGTLEISIDFELTASQYSFPVISSPNGPCPSEAPSKKRGDGSSFSNVRTIYQYSSECVEDSVSVSSTSISVLLGVRSGCGSSSTNTGLIAGLTAGLVGGAVLFVLVAIVAGLVFVWLRRRKRHAQLEHQMQQMNSLA